MKNFKNLALISSLAFILLIGTIACEKDSFRITQTPKSISQEAVISFDTPIEFAQLKLVESKYDVRVTQIQTITKIGSIEFTEGLNLFDEINLDQITHELNKNFHEQMLTLIETYSNDQNISESDREEVIQYYNSLNNSTRSASLIVNATIVGAVSNIKLLRDEFSGGTIDFTEEILERYKNEQTMIDSRSLPKWKPNSGTMEVGQINSTKRFISHTMKWTYTNPFNGYSNATYEHDLFLNNYSSSNYPGTYLSLAEDSQERPLVDYWSCSLPTPNYLDTRFNDSNNEVAYTIGCANANAIVKNILYSNYMKISKGSANIDNSKLWFQKGHRVPSSCYTTWCSFGNANYIQFPAWTFVVPAGISWAN